MGTCCESQNNLKNYNFSSPGQVYPIETKSIKIGLGWTSDENDELGLDTSVTGLDESKNIIESICFSNPEGLNESVKLYKGNSSGSDDVEVILIDLFKVPENIEYLVIAINSYKSQYITKAENAYIRIYETNSKKELGRFLLKGLNDSIGLLFGFLQRNIQNEKWYFYCKADPLDGNTINNSYETLTNLMNKYTEE